MDKTFQENYLSWRRGILALSRESPRVGKILQLHCMAAVKYFPTIKSYNIFFLSLSLVFLQWLAYYGPEADGFY
jgi:hypothetical protein